MVKLGIGILVLLAFLLSGVFALAGHERSFKQYKGKALALGVPMYEGVPPDKYPYRSLGLVTGEVTGGRLMVTQRMTRALGDLATKAKALGANAVIKIAPHSEGSGTFRYEGEAVVFETLPP